MTQLHQTAVCCCPITCASGRQPALCPDDSLPTPGQGQGHPRPVFTNRQTMVQKLSIHKILSKEMQPQHTDLIIWWATPNWEELMVREREESGKKGVNGRAEMAQLRENRNGDRLERTGDMSWWKGDEKKGMKEDREVMRKGSSMSNSVSRMRTCPQIAQPAACPDGSQPKRNLPILVMDVPVH